jgi:small subunit ribosomal protein S17
MAETTAQHTSNRNTKIGRVVSTKMAKTIVVQVIMKRAHPLYRRVVAKSKKFYAHDESNTAHVGDTVEIEETRPMSKLKRWRLKNIIQKTKLVGEAANLDSKTA